MLAPGGVPNGVRRCCAAAGVTRARRPLGPRHARVAHVDLPVCAAGDRRASSRSTALVLARTVLVLRALGGGPLAVGWTLLLVLVMVGLLVATHPLGRTRVRARWSDQGASLLLPDGPEVRRAVERERI